MIIERREIQFEAEALIAMLAGSPRAAAAFGLARGQPQAVIFQPQLEAVRFVFPGGGQTSSVSLESARLGAMLVSFCLRLRIPLPRRAEKTIRVEPDKVILAFRTAVKTSMINLLPEGHQSDSEPASQRSWNTATA